jgi:hypothetical protein
MVSVDTAWSSGATGIARDEEIAARLRQIANADAASIFMGFSFPLKFTAGAAVSDFRKKCGNPVTALTNNGDASSGGASGGDANPSDAGANPSGGDASPNDAGASPSGGDATDGANAGPSALPRA